LHASRLRRETDEDHAAQARRCWRCQGGLTSGSSACPACLVAKQASRKAWQVAEIHNHSVTIVNPHLSLPLPLKTANDERGVLALSLCERRMCFQGRCAVATERTSQLLAQAKRQESHKHAGECCASDEFGVECTAHLAQSSAVVQLRSAVLVCVTQVKSCSNVMRNLSHQTPRSDREKKSPQRVERFACRRRCAAPPLWVGGWVLQ
jgi:hypothetical protein